MTIFNPNDPGMANGNYFALPYSLEESEIALISVPWDVTTSYRAGTHKGPEAIIKASVQVDLYDVNVKDAWKTKIGTLPVDSKILKDNKKFRKIAENVIEGLERGKEINELERDITLVNKASTELNNRVYTSCRELIKQGKITGVIGGDHSVPLGNIKAVSELCEEFGILHIDAHADLRKAYE